MKNLILIAFSFLITTTTFAQGFLGMKVLKYGVFTGNDQDRVRGLDAEYFMNLSQTPIDSEMRNHEFSSQNLISMTCENPNIRGIVTVQPFENRSNWVLDLGATMMFNRIDATDYRFINYGLNTPQNEFRFKSRSHEAALDATLLYNKKFGPLNLYGGVGTNLGMTFSGRMTVHGTIYNEIGDPVTGFDDPVNISYTEDFYSNYHDIKNVLHQRAFVQGGVSVLILKRLELGIEARTGVGYRVNAGNALKGTHLVGGGLTAKWNLR